MFFPSRLRLWHHFFLLPWLFACGFFFCLTASTTAQAAGSIPTAEDGNGLGLDIGNANPVLRIAFVSSTKGELYACPTCGDFSLGGLSRRSAFLQKMRGSGVPVLFIAGPDEFLSDLDINRLAEEKAGKLKPPAYEGERAKRLFAAQEMFKVDCGWLSSDEAGWLKEHTGKIPSGFHIVTDSPLTHTLKTPAGTVGVVLFPRGKGANNFPTQTQAEAILEAGKALKKQCSLVVGISPWGNVAEYRFLPEAEKVFSILFGAGGGLGFPFSTESSTKKILWVRSQTHGRSINSLDIFEMPAPGAQASWLEDVSFVARQTFLYLQYPTDPAMDAKIGTSYQGWAE